MKTILFSLALIISSNFCISQEPQRGILYSAEFWIDFAGNAGDFVKAMNNLKREKVEIIQTTNNFKVKLGDKTQTYTIKSIVPISNSTTEYNVISKSNNSEYKLRIVDNSKSGFKVQYPFMISLEDSKDESVWSVSQVINSKEIEIK